MGTRGETQKGAGTAGSRNASMTLGPKARSRVGAFQGKPNMVGLGSKGKNGFLKWGTDADPFTGTRAWLTPVSPDRTKHAERARCARASRSPAPAHQHGAARDDIQSRPHDPPCRALGARPGRGRQRLCGV